MRPSLRTSNHVICRYYATIGLTNKLINVPPLVKSVKRDFHATRRLESSVIGEDPIKNFLDFKYPNKVTTFEHHKMPQPLLDKEYNYPVCRDTMGIRWPGYWFKRRFVYVAEMEPELVVPDLEGFDLKPYVSYKADDVENKPFTAKDLFISVYADQIVNDFKEGKLDEYNVTQEEIDQARLKPLQTGADLFEDYTLDGVRAPMEYVVETSK